MPEVTIRYFAAARTAAGESAATLSGTYTLVGIDFDVVAFVDIVQSLHREHERVPERKTQVSNEEVNDHGAIPSRAAGH